VQNSNYKTQLDLGFYTKFPFYYTNISDSC